MRQTRRDIIYILMIVVAVLIAFWIHDNVVIGTKGLVTRDIPTEVTLSDTLPAYPTIVIDQPAEAVRVAERVTSPSTTTTIPYPTGVNGLPFAPYYLTGCDEFNFYRVQFGLPDRFSALAYRESRCTNDVRTSCCFGYLQLYVSLHLKDHRTVDGVHACGVYSYEDINDNTPLDKQRNVCEAAVVFSVVGYAPWSTG